MATEGTSTALVVDGAHYDVVEGPPPGSKAVLAARAEVMQNLDLASLLLDLERTNDMLYVASCGVAGSRKDASLSGKIASLQYKLLTACSDAMLAMGSFRESAGAVLVALRSGLRFLYTDPPREDRAITVLTRCEAHATAMAQVADGLAESFKGLANDAESTLEKTLDERDMEEQSRLAALQRKEELKALDEKAKALKVSLGEQMVKVQKLIDEAKAAQDKAENRAFGLAIVGNITSALGAGVAAFAAVKAAPLTLASNLANAAAANATRPPAAAPAPSPAATPAAAAPAGSKPTPKPTPKPKPTLKTDTSEEDEEDEDDDSSATSQPKPAAKPTPAAGKPTPRPAAKAAETPGPARASAPLPKPAATDPKAASSTTPKSAPAAASDPKAAAPAAGDSKTAAEVAAAVAAGTAEVAAGNQKMAASYDAIAERYAAEKTKYLDLLMQLQAEQRQALGSIAEYAEQMKIATNEEAVSASAVDSLQQAVAALKQIVGVLETAKIFWQMMAAACRRLAQQQIRDDIKLFMEDPPEERLAEYTRPAFKQSLLQLGARWYALQLIAEEYQAGVAEARECVKGTIGKAPSIEEARKLAPKLGEKLQLDIDKDLHELDLATAQLKDEQALLQAALPAARAADTATA